MRIKAARRQSRLVAEGHGGLLARPPLAADNLFARATDNLGLTNDSASMFITNKTPGFVKLDSPQGSGGTFSMLITGEPGQVYDVQSSTNLVNWTTERIMTNVNRVLPFVTNMTTLQKYFRVKVTN